MSQRISSRPAALAAIRPDIELQPTVNVKATEALQTGCVHIELNMIYVRKAEDRGHANHGWLDSWHTFSFADYYDPNFMGFSALRVINEDVIDAGQGFGTHPHKDMEILTYVLSGTVEHQDSMGNKEQIQAGEFQIMSAGTGVRHSEYNANQDRPLHLYQIWIIPDQVGLEPRYEQRMFDAPQGRQLVLSPDARDGSLKVFQDMTLSRWALNKGEQSEYAIDAGRRIWIQVVRGKVSVNGQAAGISDAFAVWDESALTIQADEESEILLFDLPPV